MTTLFKTGSAIISDCGKYRYRLIRKLSADNGRSVTFIMLNPSTADAETDDPTIRKCQGFARRWGCSELMVVNLFAYRATQPADLFKAADPFGPDNRDHIEHCAERAGKNDGIVIAAWGAHGDYLDQDMTTFDWLDTRGIAVEALRLTASGQPGHPLYIPYETERLPYAGRRRH